MTVQKGFVLRKAGSAYWLLDVRDAKASYRKPLQMNETGAEIYQKYAEGLSTEEIAKDLGGEYGIDFSQTFADVRAFAGQLADYGALSSTEAEK